MDSGGAHANKRGKRLERQVEELLAEDYDHVHHRNKWPTSMITRYKWLSMAGTIAKKFPFEIERINQGRFSTVIVLAAGGYRDGTKRWLLGKRNEKLIAVMDIGGITRMHQKEVI